MTVTTREHVLVSDYVLSKTYKEVTTATYGYGEGT